MQKLKVGFVQINSTFANQTYLPYSVGRLQAYAQKFSPSPERYEYILPVYCRIGVGQAVSQLT